MTAAIALRRGSKVGVALCESCAQLPAVVGVAWPDTAPFVVCAGCAPQPNTAAAVGSTP